MTVGINNGLTGSIADGLSFDNTYPIQGTNNPTQPFRDNWKVAQASIENLQSKSIAVSGDVSGTSVIFDSGYAPITLTLTLDTVGVTPGIYDLAQFELDDKGRVISATDVSADYLPVAGGTMSGSLILDSDPTGALEAATKQYVDSAVSGISGGQVVLADGSVPMTGALTLSGNPTLAAHAANKSYVDSLSLTKLNVNGSNSMTGALDMGGFKVTSVAAPTNSSDAVTLSFANANYLSLTGGTLTGALTLSADPVNALEASTKQYVDAIVGSAPADLNTLEELAAAINNDPLFFQDVAGKLDVSGGTMTGTLVLDSDPVAALDAAPKQYVDTMLPLAGGTMTGALILNADPTSALDASTKQYTDTKLALSGGTLTGTLTLSADPVNALEASTKQYVDDSISAVTGTGTYLELAGGTMTGSINMNGNAIASLPTPVADDDAATKIYVDDAVSAISLSNSLIENLSETTSVQTENATYFGIYMETEVNTGVSQPIIHAYANETVDSEYLQISNAANAISLELRTDSVNPTNFEFIAANNGTYDFAGTNAVRIPAGTDAERPAAPETGHIRYNFTNSRFEGYNGTFWKVLSDLEDADGGTRVTVETSNQANDNTISLVCDNTIMLRTTPTQGILYGDWLVGSGDTFSAAGDAGSDLGKDTLYWRDAYISRMLTRRSVAAIYYVPDAAYAYGTVVEIGGAGIDDVTIATQESPRLAGIIADPATCHEVLDTDIVGGVEVAVRGKVQCRVNGTISRGDLLTVSSTSGVATYNSSWVPVPGAIVGRALEDYTGPGEGSILVAINI